MTREEILAEVEAERLRQRAKWDTGLPHLWGYGDCSSDKVPIIVKAAVLAEEAGEVVKAVLDGGPYATTDVRPEWAEYRERVRAEVIQTLAVAWAILEGM